MASPAVNLSADKGPLVLRSIYPCAAAATLAVVARFTSRKLMRVQWAVDDYAVLVCLVGFASLCYPRQLHADLTRYSLGA